MDLMPIDRLGARQQGRSIEFGVFLPGISTAAGYAVSARIIPEHDQFLQAVPAVEVALQHQVDADYGDYWSGTVQLDTGGPPGSVWGSPGHYVYRYCVRSQDGLVVDWVIDPFARESGVGKQSAITVDYQPYAWSDAEAAWKTPQLDDLIIYEVNLAEFARDLDGAVARLGYLADLGITCLQLMPVSNIAAEVDWGYLPIGYFGVDERFGRRRDLQRLVDQAHQSGLAVLVDAIYGHASSDFAYSYLYRNLGIVDNPVLGSFGDHDWFGESTNFNAKFTRDLFYTVNHFWLDAFHVDGFRYDCVPNYYAGPFAGYGTLCYSTYQLVQANRGTGGHWDRFFADDGTVTLIQCAEQLEKPVEVLNDTYTTCTWQDATLSAATDVARSLAPQRLTDLGLDLGLFGYPTAVTAGGDTLPKSAVQYLENHDHWRFVCNFSLRPEQADVDLFVEGDRSRWYKLQPYLIGLLTAKGIPLLFQGQELCENYSLPGNGLGRVALLRPVRWDYFYDDIGRRVVALVRALIRLRRSLPQLRSQQHHFFDGAGVPQGVVLFSRSTASAWSLVALNFTDQDQTVPVTLPVDGDYREELHRQDLLAVTGGVQTPVRVPSNYGRIWTAP
jgi:maltooligosyltrehalose trehalohydrolase